MSGLLQIENQYWKCWFTGTKMSLVKYCLTKDAITSGNDLCLWPLRALFIWISTNGEYFYTHIYSVARSLYLSTYHCSTIQTETLPAQDPLKTFYYTYLLFISCCRHILLFTSQVLDKLNDSSLIAIYLKVLRISRRKCIESYDGHAKEAAIVI